MSQGRIISAKEKTKNMIILKSIIKMNDTMERNIYIRIDCIYYEENNNMI